MATTPEPATLIYSDEPTVLIFADAENQRRPVVRAVEVAGARVGATLPLSDAVERMRHRSDAVVVVLSEDGGAALDELFASLVDAVRSGRQAAVVIVPRTLIDVAEDWLHGSEATLLCEPDEFDLAAAIGGAIGRRKHRLGDKATDAQGTRLKELSEDVARIARTLATLAAEEWTRPAGLVLPGEAPIAPVDAGLIRAMIRARRLREQFFAPDLFADPAWDMLLDLMAARLERRPVAVSSLCIAASVPPTTALRWIKTLTEGKLFARVNDNNDGRRVFIQLTEEAASGMMAYLTAFQRIMTLRS